MVFYRVNLKPSLSGLSGILLFLNNLTKKDSRQAGKTGENDILFDLLPT